MYPCSHSGTTLFFRSAPNFMVRLLIYFLKEREELATVYLLHAIDA